MGERASTTNDKSCCKTSSSCGAWTVTAKFRFLFVSVMILTGIGFGIVAYFTLARMETNTAEKTFDSIAASALEQAQAIAQRKQQGADSLATTLSFAFPSADQWPLVGLRGYTQLATKIALLSASAGHGFMAIVENDQIEQFEEHAKKLYEEFGYPEKAGYSEFGFGVYGIDPSFGYSDERFHDISGEREWENRYNITAPFLQHKNTFKNPDLLLRNLHQFQLRGALMESIIDCGKAAAARGDTTSPSCGGITNFTKIFVRPGPSAVFFDPIFPADDPTTVVGFIGTSINFEEVLTNVFPDFVDGVHCTISDKHGQAHIYTIDGGQPRLLGEGELHETRRTSEGQSILLTEHMKTGAAISAEYTLSIYPSQVMYDSYSTWIPLIAALGLAGVVALCTGIFFVYDYFMKDESRRRQLVLEAKRRFVRFVSHEIRTPLNVVSMGLDLMLTELREQVEQDSKNLLASAAKDPLQQSNSMATASTKTSDPESTLQDPDQTSDSSKLLPEIMHLANEIQENAQNAVTVLSDLLNYDRVESGTFEFDYGRIQIFKSIKKTVNEFAIQARNRSIQIHTTIECPAVDCGKDTTDSEYGQDERNLRHLFVLGDERRINLVIRNLVSNALKFCENKDFQVTLTHLPDGLPDVQMRPDMIDKNKPKVSELMAASKRAGAVRIVVKDNGIGLNEDQLALLFNEGVQFNPEILQHGGGSGLGLCLTREIVKQHEGCIKATSKGLGHGSEFYIDLPLHESPPDTVRLDDETSSISTCSREEHHHILVVDDVRTNTKMLARLLERAGHTCVTASNGREAIDTFVANQKQNDMSDGEERLFDTILMDYEMPVLNGPQATKELRDMGCTTVIFGVTGNVLSEDVTTFKDCGADAVLLKPMNLPMLESAWEDVGRRRNTNQKVLVPS